MFQGTRCKEQGICIQSQKRTVAITKRGDKTEGNGGQKAGDGAP